MDFELKSNYKSLPQGMKWENIPNFAVITGKNGTGKSQLLECLKSEYNIYSNKNILKPIGFINSNETIYRSPILHIPANHNFISNRADNNFIHNNFIHNNFIHNNFIQNNNEVVNIQNNLRKVISKKEILKKYGINILAYENINDFSKKISEEKHKYEQNSSEDKELSDINNLHSSIKLHHSIFEYVCKKLNKSIEDISIEEFDEKIILEIGNNLSTSSQLINWFYTWTEDFRKKSSEAIDENNNEKIEELKNMKPPWDLINSILEEHGFKYKMKKFSRERNPLKIEFTDGNTTIPIESLSSGEQQLIALVAWAHHDILEQNIKLLLLDEPDSHLHPSFCKIFLDVIQEYIVKKNIQVIMTTHSPSTIAYTPEESIFVMNEVGVAPRIEKCKKDEALKVLTDGLINLSNEEAGSYLSLKIKETDKQIIVFTEGITDCKLIFNTFKTLDLEINFELQETFGYKFLSAFILNDEIIKIVSSKTIIAIFDFDDAYTHFDKKHNKIEKLRNTPHNTIIYKRKNAKIYAMFLPVPNFREKYASETITPPSMTIEHLFEDNVIEDYCNKKDCLGGGSILKFNDGRKKDFSEKRFSKEECEEFKKINYIFKWINEHSNNN